MRPSVGPLTARGTLAREPRGVLPVLPRSPSKSPTKLPTWDPGSAPERKAAVSQLLDRDMAAKQRVARLQRDLLRVRSDEALRTLQARNRELVSSMRAEATLRRMRPTTSDMLADGVEAADEADVVNVASQLFSRMQQMQPGEQPRSMLFRLLGENHSGRVDYSGFENLVRRELGLNTKAIPKSRLQAVWAALDTQLRGSISEGDLGRFMRRGEPQDEGPQQRLLKARQGTARELRAELDAMFHRDVRREMRDKPRASDEELAQLSALLNAHTTHDQRAQALCLPPPPHPLSPITPAFRRATRTLPPACAAHHLLVPHV